MFQAEQRGGPARVNALPAHAGGVSLGRLLPENEENEALSPTLD